MKCLLCNANFLIKVELKNHYIWFHYVNENVTHFNNLFKPDSPNKSCNICEMYFENSRSKKNYMFLFHHGQTRGSRGRNLPINVLRIGPITYYTIFIDQHKNFYDVFNEQIVDDFLDAVYSRYEPNMEKKRQGYAE